jgi:hypothetical protein
MQLASPPLLVMNAKALSVSSQLRKISNITNTNMSDLIADRVSDGSEYPNPTTG